MKKFNMQSFRINVTPEDKKQALEIAEKHKIGKRNDGSDGRFEEKVEGIIGEIVFARTLGLKLDKDYSCFDSGVDFEVFDAKVDVKTRGIDCEFRPSWSVHLYPHQVYNDRYFTDLYFFLSYNTKEDYVEFLGHIWKRQILQGNRGIRTFRKGEKLSKNGNPLRTSMIRINLDALNKFESPEKFLFNLEAL